ncbi:hypothetical protein [uncultured Cyclobacterium sp.]|uniref:hypothetical protein n=1 Tax=uncultured Cyclobacterium sp. TaxID=453820 RepID=UPI0030EDDAD0
MNSNKKIKNEENLSGLKFIQCNLFKKRESQRIGFNSSSDYAIGFVMPVPNFHWEGGIRLFFEAVHAGN